jgi:UDPglucose 6-dehydrogenase
MGIGSDSRIGYGFLYAGCGYGGSCFPKDVKALIKTAAEHGHGLKVLGAVEDANDAQKSVLVNKVVKAFGENLSGKRFALWGLAFKPNTDDMREAPSRVIIEALLSRGATICAYDPVAMDEAKRVLGDQIDYAASAHAALQDADALVIVTEWKEFRSPSFEAMAKTLKSKRIFDGRNLYDPALPEQHGLSYEAIGRKISRKVERTL